jgi:hypothetical protein
MLIVRQHGPDAREALWVAVDDAKAGDPLAPVTVAAPSPFASLSLRRLLATRPGHLGLVNVRFLPLARIAELLGAPSLAATGRRPLTPALRMEAVRAVLAARPGPLAGAAAHPATERSLSTTFAEFGRADPGAVTALASGTGLPAAIAGLYRDFRDRTAAFYDEEDLARAAADTTLEGSAGDELGVVVLYLPTGLSPGETALVETIAGGGRLRVVLGVTGDADVDEPVRELERRLGVLLDAASSAPGGEAVATGTTIVSAPDPEDEIREVLRLVLARSRAGTPLHRVAVLYRLADPYARIAADVFEAARVPWAGPATRTLADGVAARVLIGLLDLAEADFARDAVGAWLASGPVLDPVDGRSVPASRWDLISRDAGIVGGLEQWDERLARFVHEHEVGLAEAKADDAASDGTVARLESDLEHALRLHAFVADLGQRVRPPEPATWPAMTAWARDLLDTYLGGEGRRRLWPEVELETARATVAALESLGVLAEIRPAVDLSVFRRALEAELDAPARRIGRFGEGVFIGPLRAAFATDFDVVFVVGMAEGAFPPRGTEDPLLPDRDREAAGGLPLHTERRAEERRDYLGALASGRELVLSFPRADPRAQRKRLPARWLLDAAGGLAGTQLGAQELTELSDAPWYHVVPSFEAGLRASGDAGSLTERDVRSLRAWPGPAAHLDRHPLVAGTPELAAGMAATRERRSHRATRYDGLVGAIDGLLPPVGAALSPTALEDWATCPFRYLLARVLRVREVARPEETETLSPLTRGSLVHAVLEEFLRVVDPRTSPTQPWTDDERARLLAIAEEHCARAESDGLTGRPLLWQIERRRLLRSLTGVLDTDERFRRELGVVPSADGQEVEFGRGAPGPLAVTLGDGRTVGFRGRIDRVDLSPDRSRAVVYDYKTGRGRGYADDALEDLERGVRLQLPVYGLAARRELPDADVDAYYWFVERDQRIGFELDDALEPFQIVLGRILDGVGAGVFPAYPGDPRQDAQGRDTWDNCCYCPYDRVCPPARDDVWDRKADDPAVVVFRDLAEPVIAEPVVPEAGVDEGGA